MTYTLAEIAAHSPADKMIDAIEEAYVRLAAVDTAIVHERGVTAEEFAAMRKSVGELLIAAQALEASQPRRLPADERARNEAVLGDDRDPSHPYHQPE